MKKCIVFILCCSFFMLNAGKKTSLKNKSIQRVQKKSSSPLPSPFLKRKKIYQSFNKAFTSLALLREKVKNPDRTLEDYKIDLKLRVFVYKTYTAYVDVHTEIMERSLSFQNHFLNPTFSLVKNLKDILNIRSNLLKESNLKKQLKIYMNQTTDIMFALSEYKAIKKD